MNVQNETEQAEFFIEPYDNRIIVKSDPEMSKTASGLYIPDTAKEVPQNGTVMAVGPGLADVPMQSKVGDRIAYSKYAGSELKDTDGQIYLIMRESDIYGKLRGKAAEVKNVK